MELCYHFIKHISKMVALIWFEAQIRLEVNKIYNFSTIYLVQLKCVCFSEEFEHVAFVYISDDMQWGKKNLKKVENIFFLGCGDSDDPGKLPVVYNCFFCWKSSGKYAQTWHHFACSLKR